MDFDKMIETLEQEFSKDRDGWDDITNAIEAIDTLQGCRAFYGSFNQIKFEAFKGMLEAARRELCVSEEFIENKKEKDEYEESDDFIFSEIRNMNKQIDVLQHKRDKIIDKYREDNDLDHKQHIKNYLEWEKKQ